MKRSIFDVFSPFLREYFTGICIRLFCGMYDLWIIAKFLGILLLNSNSSILAMKGTNNRLLPFNIFNIVSLSDSLCGLLVTCRTPLCHRGILPVDINLRKKMSCAISYG